MKKILSTKNKSNISILKNRYYITLENVGKRTAGQCGPHQEQFFSAAHYQKGSL